MKKKYCFLTIIYVALATCSFTQGLSPGPVTGIGFNNYKITYVDSEDEAYYTTSSITGFHFGVTADYQFGGRFGIEPSILFSQKGNKLDVVSPNNTNLKYNYNSTHTINYIDVPLLFKYKVGSPERGIAIMAGPSLNFAIGGSYTESGVAEGIFYDNAGSSYKGKFKFNETDKQVRIGDKVNSNYNQFEIAFVLGVGGYFEIGESGKLIIEARYNLGGTNILNSKYVSGSTAKDNGAQGISISGYNIINDKDIISSVKNSGFQFSIGYLFDL